MNSTQPLTRKLADVVSRIEKYQSRNRFENSQSGNSNVVCLKDIRDQLLPDNKALQRDTVIHRVCKKYGGQKTEFFHNAHAWKATILTKPIYMDMEGEYTLNYGTPCTILAESDDVPCFIGFDWKEYVHITTVEPEIQKFYHITIDAKRHEMD